MNKLKQKIGVIINPVCGLNYGQTVDIFEEFDIPEEGYIIQPHGTKHILSVLKTSVYIDDSMDYFLY